ncbi:hypothetical protein FS837_000414 [Tulasnella sp. UAMH 9824]|nr:hypothetical protein FS837_000414 [Tulasnella sp. UAMH 9824]
METPTAATDVVKLAFNMLVSRANQGGTALPPDSSRCILAYDNHIRAIEALVASLVTEAKDHLSTLKQSRNTLAPIHVLPDELLVNIWLLCVQDASQIDDLLHTLALVCRSWYQGVLNHPALWCHLQDTCKSEWYNDWVLQKSRNCPLHLRLSSDDPYASNTLINMAMPECRRWKSFILAPCYGNGSQTVELRLNMLGNANLDNLTRFEAQPRTSWVRPEAISLPATPALREIKLERFPLHWKTFNSPQLRALRMSAIRFDAPSFPQLLDLLRSTPLLEILLLKDTSFAMSPQAGPSHQTAPVHLPRLRALYLSFPADSLADDFLRLIRTESLQQLLGRTVSFNLWEPPRPPILNNIKLSIPQTRKIDLYYHNNIHIATDPHPFYPIQWPYPDEVLTTEGFAFTTTKPAEMDDFFDIAQWVSSLGPHTIVKLELSNPWWRREEGREIPAALLDHLPTLHTLVVREGVNVNALFTQLGRPKRESSGRLHWPWPQLVNLDLGDSNKIDAQLLIDLAQSRWGDTGARPSTSEASVEHIKEERAARLTSLALPYGFSLEDRLRVEILALEGGPRPESPNEGLDEPSNSTS